MSGHVKTRLVSQLIKGIARVLLKLLKYFNGNIISTPFVPLLPVTRVIFCLNLNEAVLSTVWKLAIAPAWIKDVSFLYYCHKPPDVFQ